MICTQDSDVAVNRNLIVKKKDDNNDKDLRSFDCGNSVIWRIPSYLFFLPLLSLLPNYCDMILCFANIFFTDTRVHCSCVFTRSEMTIIQLY